jgi:hypothetical protein
MRIFVMKLIIRHPGILRVLEDTDPAISHILLADVLRLLLSNTYKAPDEIVGELHAEYDAMERLYDQLPERDPYLVENSVDDFVYALSSTFEYPYNLTDFIDLSTIWVKKVDIIGRDGVILTI